MTGSEIKDILTKSVSERRNPLIAEIFHKIKLVEKWGTGIGKIKRLEPKTTFEEVNDFFLVTFKRKDVAIKTTQKTTQKILEAIYQNAFITRKELSRLENISEDGIKYHLDKMRKEGIIKRKGPDKGGQWQITKK